MKKYLAFICSFLFLVFVLMPASSLTVSAEELLKTDKTVYSEGEEIKITATGQSGDWVGIYLRSDTVGNEPAIRWYYVAKDGNTSGSEKSILSAEHMASERSDLLQIPAGEYMVCLCSDDSYHVVAKTDITVTKSDGVAVDKTLKTNKMEYTEGEPILVTATGDKADWVGIYQKGEAVENVDSIRWYYIAGEGNHSGEAKNILESEYVNRQELADLPAGAYTLYLLENNGYMVLAQLDITIKAVSAAPEDPLAPTKPGEPIDPGTDKPAVPQTGENDQMLVFPVLTVISAAGASLFLIRRKRTDL